jgi:hypothetical protein
MVRTEIKHPLSRIDVAYTRSAFEVDTRDLEKPIMKLEVMIDGSAAYQYVPSPVLFSAYFHCFRF